MGEPFVRENVFIGSILIRYGGNYLPEACGILVPCGNRLSGVGSILIRYGEFVSNRRCNCYIQLLTESKASNRRCNCYIQLLTESKGPVMMRLLEARGM